MGLAKLNFNMCFITALQHLSCWGSLNSMASWIQPAREVLLMRQAWPDMNDRKNRTSWWRQVLNTHDCAPLSPLVHAIWSLACNYFKKCRWVAFCWHTDIHQLSSSESASFCWYLYFCACWPIWGRPLRARLPPGMISDVSTSSPDAWATISGDASSCKQQHR